MWNIPQLQDYVKRLPKPVNLKLISDRWKFGVLGGTFDRLHIGHKTLINTALKYMDKLLLCITTDRYVKQLRKIAGDLIEPYDARRRNVASFLKEIGCIKRTHLCELEDPYSPAVFSEYAPFLDSIIISEDPYVFTRTIKLNKMRVENGLKPLVVLRIPLLLDPFGIPFSSTRYRINDYFPEPRPPNFILPQDLIEEVRKPKGILVDSPKELPDPHEFKETGIIAIGDSTFVNLVRAGYPISVAIVDFKHKRKNIDYLVYVNNWDNIFDVPAIIPLRNEAGNISTFSWFSILIAFVQEKFSIVGVYGEEDLLGFPATILAPEGALIIYGDPFKNKLVYFVVDDHHKELALKLLSKMKSSK